MNKSKLLGQLEVLRALGTKPNFSELSRIYGIDRHTIKKYWINGGIRIEERKNRMSILDKYIEEIKELFNKPGVNKTGVYYFLVDKYGADNIGSLSNFRHYTFAKGIKAKESTVAHVRFETAPGKQLQVDWKESLMLHTKKNEEIKFEIYSCTLSYSRYHLFIYSKGKTTEDFLRCTITALNRLGGIPEHILTDNMSAVVSINNGTKHKHAKIKSFENDCGLPIRLCKTRNPQTKGKDESANRFIQRLMVYDRELDDEQHLIRVIDELTRRVNITVNQTTNIPPVKLFEKEKEYLRPLPSKVLLESYVDTSFTTTVPSTLLISYKGSEYSVPARYIGKRVKVYLIENKLYVYFNTELISVHEITNRKINYHTQDYIEGLRQTITAKAVNDEDFDRIARENLELFDKMGE